MKGRDLKRFWPLLKSPNKENVKNMVNIFKHRCRYKIIGTAFMSESHMIMCDLICPKCGKIGTVYVPDLYKEKIWRSIHKGKYFRLPSEDVYTEREFINIFVNN